MLHLPLSQTHFILFPSMPNFSLRIAPNRLTSHSKIVIDDPHKVVKVIASDGKTGDTKEIAYTNCKVIGNGSFGVVFQARMVGSPEDGKDIAIKKVLQDKRFKAGPF